MKSTELPWSEIPIFGLNSRVYPIYLVGVEQKDNIAIVTWDVPPNCLSGVGTVLISKDGKTTVETVNLGYLKPWGKRVAVVLNIKEPIYVKLRITSGNGVFMSSWIKLTPTSTLSLTREGQGEIRPQAIPGIIGVIVVVGQFGMLMIHIKLVGIMDLIQFNA